MTAINEMMTDRQLWQSVRTGNRNALAELYKQYVKLLYNYGMKVCANAQLVEDSIQDLFIDIWRFHKNLSDAHTVRFYLYASLRRKITKQHADVFTIHDHLSTWRMAQDDLIVSSEESRIVATEINSEQVRRLQKLLNNLPPRQYEAIVLRFYDNLSFDEIGLVMEINSHSVRNLVERGLEKLRQFSRISV